MAKPVTKYAVTVTRPEDVAYELEKCIYEATHGRKGPVWLDNPLDIQSEEIEPEELLHFKPTETPASDDFLRNKAEILRLLSKAKRPLILVGHGVYASGAQEELRDLVEVTGIPVLSTWRALDFMGEGE